MNRKETIKEIDLLALFKDVLAQKKNLSIVLCASALIGVIVAFSTPKSFTSEVILAPELSSGGIGLPESLSDMASAIGFDIGQKSSIDAIYPELYPIVFTSTDFILRLFDINVCSLNHPENINFKEYLTKEQKIPFLVYLKMWITTLLKSKDEGIKQFDSTANNMLLSKKDEQVVEAIRGSISCLVDKKTSVIYISYTDQDPVVAAIITDTLQCWLQNYITDYRTKKVRVDVEYYEKLYRESKAKYEESQRKYASFHDSNLDATLGTITTKRDELENEMQLRYNIFNQVSTQLQSAQSKVQERTPVFTIIQKPRVPNKASSMPRLFIVGFFVVLGFIGFTLYILYKNKKMNRI